MKFNIYDTTFLIPCFHDHSDRDENIHLCIKILKNDFRCKIIVGENQSESFSHLGDTYMHFNYDQFHRTRMLNEMARAAKTPIIVNFDCDVLVPPLQLLQAVEAVRNGADMVYPYDGRFARVPRDLYPQLNELRDVGILTDNFKGTNPRDQKSVGGAILFNRESYFKAGGENERFVSYSPEDQERYYRFETLGYKIERIPGILYHLDHEITINSSFKQPMYKQGREELAKVKTMSKTELLEYVASW